jgi:hypothetical protein
VGIGLLTAQVARSHLDTPHSAGLLLTQCRDLLPDHIQHSQETDIHALGGIRTIATQPRCSILFKGHLGSCNQIKIRTQQILYTGKRFARIQLQNYVVVRDWLYVLSTARKIFWLPQHIALIAMNNLSTNSIKQ